MMQMYKVRVRRWRYFTTLESAKAFCELYFRRNGIVLSIVRCGQ